MIEFDRAKVMQPKTVVHCRTEEQAEAFCDWMHSIGEEWCDGTSYANDHMWHVHKEQTHYDLFANTFGRTNEFNYPTILTYEEALAEATFERGELVEMRNGCGKWEKRIYLGSIDRSTNPFIAVCVFDEDKFNTGKMFDTVKWQQIRKIPTKTLTWDEVQDILVEKFGTNVDIKIEEK